MYREFLTQKQKDFIGTRFYHKKYGWYEVIDLKRNSKPKKILFHIKFDNTGFIGDASRGNIEKNEVSDKSIIIVHKIGTCKDIKLRKENKKEYELWANMVNRCYGEKHLKRAPSYQKVKICKEWLRFENFFNDVQELKNYYKWKTCKGYELDKDASNNGYLYSKNNCMFLSKTENLKLKKEDELHNNQKHLFLFKKEKDLKWGVHFGIKDFCRKYNVSKTMIYQCLDGKVNTHRGYNFKRFNFTLNNKIIILTGLDIQDRLVVPYLFNKLHFKTILNYSIKKLEINEKNNIDYKYITKENIKSQEFITTNQNELYKIEDFDGKNNKILATSYKTAKELKSYFKEDVVIIDFNNTKENKDINLKIKSDWNNTMLKEVYVYIIKNYSNINTD